MGILGVKEGNSVLVWWPTWTLWSFLEKSCWMWAPATELQLLVIGLNLNKVCAGHFLLCIKNKQTIKIEQFIFVARLKSGLEANHDSLTLYGIYDQRFVGHLTITPISGFLMRKGITRLYITWPANVNYYFTVLLSKKGQVREILRSSVISHHCMFGLLTLLHMQLL